MEQKLRGCMRSNLPMVFTGVLCKRESFSLEARLIRRMWLFGR